MPADHFSVLVPTDKLEGVIKFLTKSLEHLGMKEMMRPAPNVVGMGETMPYLWLAGVPMDGVAEATLDMLMQGTHIAFSAKSIQQVKQFYTVSMEAGGIDNGKPGRRPEYHKGYYAAFVRDPECKINWEVVLHSCPEDEEALRKLEEEINK